MKAIVCLSLLLSVYSAKVQRRSPTPTITLAPRQASACTSPLSTTYLTSPGVFTVPSGTYAEIQNPAIGLASQGCAVVAPLGNALGILQGGGTGTFSGLSTHTATASVVDIGTISGAVYATLAPISSGFSSISIMSLGTGAVFDFAQLSSQYAVQADTIGPGAALSMTQPSYPIVSLVNAGNVLLSADTSPVTLVVSSVIGYGALHVLGSQATVSILNAQSAIVQAQSSGFASVSGTNVAIAVTSPGASVSANVVSGHGSAILGGTVYMTGTANAMGYVNAFGSFGGAQGTANIGGGSVTVGAGAAATVFAGTVVVQGDAGMVEMSSGAAATMRAIVTAVSATPAVTLSPGPGATIVQIGGNGQKRQNSGYTYSAAASYQSGIHRRAQMPMRTQEACARGRTYCPVLGAGGAFGFACIDIDSDIFNCGGCSETGIGSDCTSLTDGDVQCIQGQCVFEEPEELEASEDLEED